MILRSSSCPLQEMNWIMSRSFPFTSFPIPYSVSSNHLTLVACVTEIPVKLTAIKILKTNSQKPEAPFKLKLTSLCLHKSIQGFRILLQWTCERNCLNAFTPSYWIQIVTLYDLLLTILTSLGSNPTASLWLVQYQDHECSDPKAAICKYLLHDEVLSQCRQCTSFTHTMRSFSKMFCWQRAARCDNKKQKLVRRRELVFNKGEYCAQCSDYLNPQWSL